MDESGRGGRFRVITNLDEALAKEFKILPSMPGIEVANIEMRLPYAVDGDLRIRPGVPPGDYGLHIQVGAKEVFRRDGMIHIVRPNVGQSGFIQGVVAQEPFHRPGDLAQLYVQATGLMPDDVAHLTARVPEFDMGVGSFTYLSPSQLRLAFQTPSAASTGTYSVVITGSGGQTLFEKKKAFTIVGADWVAGVQVSPPVHPGQSGLLKVLGRDLSPAFAQALQVQADETGIRLGPLQQTDASTLSAEISVRSGVAPGDDWQHLSYQGKKIDPPYGSLIKVEP
jgi:hypothetical protein